MLTRRDTLRHWIPLLTAMDRTTGAYIIHRKLLSLLQHLMAKGGRRQIKLIQFIVQDITTSCGMQLIHFTLIYYFYIIYSARLRLSIGNLVGVVNYTDLVVWGSFIIHNRRMTFNLSFIIVLQQIERIQIMAKCPWALTVTWVYFHRKNIYFEYPYERVHFQVEFNMHG